MEDFSAPIFDTLKSSSLEAYIKRLINDVSKGAPTTEQDGDDFKDMYINLIEGNINFLYSKLEKKQKPSKKLMDSLRSKLKGLSQAALQII